MGNDRERLAAPRRRLLRGQRSRHCRPNVGRQVSGRFGDQFDDAVEEMVKHAEKYN
jgi:hypothetical protein